MTIYTIGHSTRSIDEFLQLLERQRVEILADVRTVPGSRRMPHFNSAELQRSLAMNGIRYVRMPNLGGLRKPRPDSPNTAWRNRSFRGYADYMQEPAFEEALDGLMALAGASRVAIMCAEAVPWRCHRSMIADALTARGVEVRHIIGEAEPQTHRLNPMASIRDGRVSYAKATASARHRKVAVEAETEPAGHG